jgi:hypothetical protein
MTDETSKPPIIQPAVPQSRTHPNIALESPAVPRASELARLTGGPINHK